MTWFVLFTRNERKANEALIERGFETYLPTFTRYRPQRGQMVPEGHSLFPRYLFARIPDTAFRAALSVEGVLYIVGQNPLPDETVDAIRSLIDSGTFDQQQPTTEKPKRVRYKGMESLQAWLSINYPSPLAKSA